MNHLYEQLTALKLTGFRDALKKQLAQPGTYQELGFEERLSLLTAEELTEPPRESWRLNFLRKR